MKYEIQIEGSHRVVEIEANNSEAFRVHLDLDRRDLEASAVETSQGTYSILLDGHAFEARVSEDGSDQGLLVRCGGADFRVHVRDPRSLRASRHGALEAAGPQRIPAPMPGKVVRVLVAPGDQVEAGSGLLVVEAMKMQNEIRAPKSGRIECVLVTEGQAVRTQETLVIIA